MALPLPVAATRRPVSMKSGLEGRNNFSTLAQGVAHYRGLNEVRPRRPEQCDFPRELYAPRFVSMKSGLEGRNNLRLLHGFYGGEQVSMKSGLEGRNNGSPQKAALTRNFTSTCELSAPPGPIKPLC